MVSVVISRSVILVCGTLYPAYRSYKAVKTKDVKEYVKWMMYWIVFALFSCIETIADIFASFWIPFYYELKIIFLLWLLSPYTKGYGNGNPNMPPPPQQQTLLPPNVTLRQQPQQQQMYPNIPDANELHDDYPMFDEHEDFNQGPPPPYFEDGNNFEEEEEEEEENFARGDAPNLAQQPVKGRAPISKAKPQPNRQQQHGTYPRRSARVNKTSK